MNFCKSKPLARSLKPDGACRFILAPRGFCMRAATSLLKCLNCETCGNEYGKAMEITVVGKSHWYDSLECATHALASACARSAKEEGVRGLNDQK